MPRPIVALLVCLAPFVAGLRASEKGLYESYQARDYPQFQAKLMQVEDFQPIVVEAKARLSVWSPDVAAGYLLEASAAAMRLELFPKLVGLPFSGFRRSYAGGPINTNPRRDFVALFDLSEAAIKRTRPDSTTSRAWVAAALSLLEGADEVSAQENDSLMGERLLKFVRANRDRIPAGAVLMAEGHVQESIVAVETGYNVPTLQGNRLFPGQTAVSSQFPAVTATFERALADGMDAFFRAESFPDVRDEARVRWSALAAARSKPGDLDAGIDKTRSVIESRPSDAIVFWAYMVQGRLLHLQGRETEANKSFGEAARLKPESASARFELAVESLLTGDERSADQYARAALSASVNADDPWPLFPRGEYRHWPERIVELRAVLK
jgi:tetratricopeptide (TPR) repeat protein